MELLQSLALETASDVLIKEEGTYVVSGDYEDLMIVIEADDDIIFNGGSVVVDGLVQTEIVVQQIGIGLMFDK